MEKVAFIFQGHMVFWRQLFFLLGALTGVVSALAVALGRRRRKMAGVLLALPLAMIFSLYAARLIHWYCRPESYESLSAALLRPQSGEFSLTGLFVGVFLAVLLVRLLRLTDDAGAMLDVFAPAMALGIAVGKIGNYFSAADYGKILVADAALRRLPFAAAVINPSSGAVEWRFATFCAQGLWAAFLCLLLLLRAALPKRRIPARESWRSGEDFLLFLSLYCLGQILFDSTRYDALFLRSNGFVSLEQILCCAVSVAITALYAVRAVQHRGLRPVDPLCWLLSLGGMGLVGYMEYYVQRHGDAYIFAYGLMSCGLLLYFAAQRVIRAASSRKMCRNGLDR